MTSCRLDIFRLVLLVAFREGTTQWKNVPHAVNGEPGMDPGNRVSRLLDKTKRRNAKELWDKKKRTTARPLRCPRSGPVYVVAYRGLSPHQRAPTRGEADGILVLGEALAFGHVLKVRPGPRC